jgi:hypothetical protein
MSFDNFHETVHAQRDDEDSPWAVDNPEGARDWRLSVHYTSHVNAGYVQVHQGRERDVVDVAKSVSVVDREGDSRWNCRNFVYESDQGYQTDEWYNWVENELMDKLLDGAVE